MKIRPVTAEMLHVDGQTDPDKTKKIIAPCNFRTRQITITLQLQPHIFMFQ